MYLIDPIPVTPTNGVLVSSTVVYPDVGVNFFGAAIDYPRYVRGRAYPIFTPVLHNGAIWLNFAEIPANPPPESDVGLPPGHMQAFFLWIRASLPVLWNPVDQAEGTLVHFPNVSYPNLLPASATEEEWPAIADAAHVPVFDPPGYPAGMWRRNGTPDDGESLLPKYPSLGSKYWDYMEPPVFEQFPEIPVGELTTYGGRVWRKRTATMAGYEAPPMRPDDWALVRTSNRFAMFDRSPQSKTRQRAGSRYSPPQPEHDQTIVVVLQAPAGRLVDALCLMGLEATSVRVQVATPGESPTTAYDQTRPMVNSAMTSPDWYDFLAAPRNYQSTAVFDDIPGTAGARVTITITNTGGQAAVGTCVFGQRVELGATLRGIDIGFVDYSVKTVDEWGSVDVQERGYSDRVSLPVKIHNDLLEPLKHTLLQFRARPALYVGHPSYPSTVVYGWFRDLSVSVPYPTYSTYSLEIESTT